MSIENKAAGARETLKEAGAYAIIAVGAIAAATAAMALSGPNLDRIDVVRDQGKEDARIAQENKDEGKK